MRRKPLFLVLAAAAALAIVVLPQGADRALAHPLGNFTINRYSGIELSGRQLTLYYVIDMAEIPAFSEFDLVDQNGDGQTDAGEEQAYLAAALERYRQGISATASGQPLVLKAVSSAVSFAPGQAGLRILRVDAVYQADLPEGATLLELEYRDANFEGRPGWQEVVVYAGAGAQVLSTDVPTESISDELRSYPEGSLQSPLAQNTATVSFKADPTVDGATTIRLEKLESGPRQLAGAGFTRLITAERLSATVVVFSLLAAMGFGALHAFGPGHGKTIVAAYLVGSRGTARHALFLGLTVTLTHTAMVFAVGGVTLWASQYVVPEQLYPWLTLASGLTVVALGVLLFVTRLRRTFAAHWLRTKLGLHHHHQDDGHRPSDFGAASRRPSGARLAGYAAGSSTGAPALNARPATLVLRQRGRHDHGHSAGAGHDADEMAHVHAHLPPGADGSPVTLRRLLALGISGGLLPCPSALVVLLGAISLHRAGFGMLLIVAFSIGLAGVLTGIGIALVYSRKFGARFNVDGGRRLPLLGRPRVRWALTQVVPVGSALAVAVAGAILTAGALSDPLLRV